MRIVKNGRVVENVPLILSLLRDSSWCYAWVWVGTIAVVPIITYQVYTIWKFRKDVHASAQAVVSGFLLSANAIWMFGDFFFGQDHFRSVARWIFTIGLIIGAAYMIFIVRRRQDEDEKDAHAHSDMIRMSLMRHHNNMARLRRLSAMRKHR